MRIRRNPRATYARRYHVQQCTHEPGKKPVWGVVLTFNQLAGAMAAKKVQEQTQGGLWRVFDAMYSREMTSFIQ